MTIVDWQDPTTLAEAAAAIRFRSDGAPLPGTPLWIRLFGRCEETSGGCWEFQGHHDADGYGKLRVDGRTEKAHRVAWTIVHGDPGPLHVLHHCDNPPCCNPRDLFLGTNHDNVLDRHTKGRSRATFSVDRPHPHRKISAAQVDEARALRAAGLTQQTIADHLGLSRGRVAHLVRGVLPLNSRAQVSEVPRG